MQPVQIESDGKRTRVTTAAGNPVLGVTRLEVVADGGQPVSARLEVFAPHLKVAARLLEVADAALGDVFVAVPLEPPAAALTAMRGKLPTGVHQWLPDPVLAALWRAAVDAARVR